MHRCPRLGGCLGGVHSLLSFPLFVGNWELHIIHFGLPWWLSGKESTCQSGLTPGSERSPGVGSGTPLQYFLPRKFHGQRSMSGHSPWGCERVGHDLAAKHTHTYNTFYKAVGPEQNCAIPKGTLEVLPGQNSPLGRRNTKALS